MTITPDQLPGKVSNFIAYGAEERAADPTRDGEVITIRPQVYVCYYPGLVVQNLQEGGRSGDRKGLVTVHFDPASIGFKDPISAHMNDDDATVSILRNSLENKTPLTVAIEIQRKKKNSETGSPISPLTPIHALRGATQPNGEGDGRMMMGPSGNNTSKRVAFVNGQSTQHIQSNPAEWKSLVNNKAGDLPPEGWRNFAPGDDWTEIGAAIRAGAPAATAPQSGNAPAGTFPAPTELANLIQSVVTQTLKDFAPTLANHVAQSSATLTSDTPGRPANKFDEGKQWNPRTSDGRINLGGYVVAGERWVFEWAFRYLSESLEVEASPEDAWTLSAAVITMASEVQSNAYGHGFIADRTTASHREAERWVQWAIKNVHAYPGTETDEDTLKAWSDEVVSEASSLFTEAGRRAGDYFSNVTKRDKNGAAPQAKAEKAPSGPSEKVVRAFLDVVQKGWNDSQTIRNLGAQARDGGYLRLPVSMTADDKGDVSISYPPAEGEESGPLESLLIYRLNTLQAQANAPQGDGQAPVQEPAAEEQAPQVQEDAPEQAPVQANPTSEQTAAPQENPQVASIIESLKTVSDDQSLRAIYEQVKDANLVAARVFVSQGEDGQVIFGQEGQEGFQAQSLGNVFGVMRRTMTAPTPPPAEAQETPATESTPPAPAEEHSAPEANNVTEEASAPQEEAPEAQSEQAPAEEAPSSEDVIEGSSDAQGLADAAGSANTLDEIATIKKDAEAQGLMEVEVMGGGTEGGLGLWIKHQERRIGRAQRTQK